MNKPSTVKSSSNARNICLATVSAAALAMSAGTAFAADAPVQNVVNLQASSTVEVTKDVLSLTFTTSREGSDAATVQSGLKQALDAALKEAKAAAKPDGQIEVQTGNFSIYPRYAPKGGITGWVGSAELLVEGRDMVGISQLSGRITTMSIGRVSQSLSRQQREKVEADVTSQAIASYRARAADYAKLFGFTAFQIREVSVNVDQPNNYAAPMQMRAKAMVASDEALPVEAGKGTVTASVNGSVVMTK
ncbi:hypothetical protein BH09PSE5_BH09PSE5_02810 [soil metagenome]